MSLNYDEEGFLRPLHPQNHKSQQCFWTFKHTVIALVVLFPYITIPILFGMVANIDKTTNNYNQAVVTMTLPISSSDYPSIQSKSMRASSDIKVTPFAWSLNNHGQLQIGAGTSIYKNQSMYESSCPMFIDLDAVFDSSYIMSYYDKPNEKAVISIVQVNSVSDVHIASASSYDYNIYELSVLDQSSGLFVFISQDTSVDTKTAYLVAGHVDSESFDVTLGTGIEYANLYSLNPLITKLSSKTFAMSYYDYTVTPNLLLTRYGSIDPDTLAISLSPAVEVVSDEANSIYNSIQGLTPTSYLISYYNSNTTIVEDTRLISVLATVSLPTVHQTIADVTITLSSPSYLGDSLPAYYLASTRINNNTAVISFADRTSNYGLRMVAVSIDSTISSAPIFSSSLQVTSGQTFTTINEGVIPDLDLNTVYSTYQRYDAGSGSGNAVISALFSDLSNGGALETVLVQLSSSGSLVRISPDYVLNNGNPSFETTYSWGAMSTAIRSSSYSQSLIVSALTSIDCSFATSFEFSVVEILPTAVGISTSSISSYNPAKSTLQVVLSGTVSGFSSLVPGMPYYATSKGFLVPGVGYYGSYPSTSFSTTSYVDTSDDVSSTHTGIITSLDSFVGVAVSTTTLLLSIT